MNETELDALKQGSAFLYRTLNNVALLHEADAYESENGEEIQGCVHCSTLVGEDSVVSFPCPTMRIVLNDFEIEATSSEPESAE